MARLVASVARTGRTGVSGVWRGDGRSVASCASGAFLRHSVTIPSQAPFGSRLALGSPLPDDEQILPRPEALEELESQGVERGILWLPPAGADDVLPRLRRYAELLPR